ncbi:MAG: S8 family serine peptidase [Deltaproteobacteria bacterium]|nr:S8 family serine peptidase [Deltaproteobacteria bacterium]
MTSALPNDPFLHSSGSWGQDFPDLWGLFQIHAPEAWELSQGEGVIVAVIDTGIDIEHPDLAANVWHNAGEVPGNGVDDDGNGFVDDVNGWDFTTCALFFTYDPGCALAKERGPDVRDQLGHGTHVAGTIGAVGDNSIGIIGAALQAQVMAVKGLNAQGSGTNADLAEALVYAAENGAKVINASWAGPPSDTIETAIEYVTQQFDVVVVASVDNGGIPLERGIYPANLPAVIAAGATTHSDEHAPFSNFGGPLDLVAPGGGDSEPASAVQPQRSILSLLAADSEFGRLCQEECRLNDPTCDPTVDDDCDLYICEEVCRVPPWVIGEQYVRGSGTSFAAPHVSGVAALVRSRHPQFTRPQIRQALRETADDLGPSGWDPTFGYGRVNARRAVEVEDTAVAEIVVPENRGKVWERDFPFAVMGSAFGPSAPLIAWRLTLRPEGGESAVEVAGGHEPVVQGALGTLRLEGPAGLELGRRYVLELVVEDAAGNQASDTKTFLISNPRYALIPVPDRYDEGGDNVTLSADGSRLALGRADRNGGDSGIWLYDAETRNLRRVASGGGYLAPNGRWLVYAGRIPGESRYNSTVLYDVDHDTHNVVETTQYGFPSIEAVVGPLDLAATRMVLRTNRDPANQNPDGQLQAFIFELPHGPMRQITSVPLGIPGADAINDMRISFDGSRVVFTSAAALDPLFSTDGRQQVFVYDDRTQTIRQLSGRPSDPPAFVERLTSSADAGTLAYLAGTDVFVVDVTSGRTDKVVDVNSHYSPPALSGDGRWLAFTSAADLDPAVGNPDLLGEVFLLDLATQEISQVTDTVRNAEEATVHTVDSVGGTLVVDPGGELSGAEVQPLLTRALRRGSRVNRRPNLVADAPLVAPEGQRTVMSLRSTDADGDPLTFYAQRVPPFTIGISNNRLRDLAASELIDHGDGTAELALTPRHNETGCYLVRIAVFDEAGEVDVRNIELIIDDAQPEGDANCDGRLRPDDIHALIHALFDPEARAHCVTADTNDDGLVRVNDLTGLLQKIIQ